jgi:hypothetical protein
MAVSHFPDGFVLTDFDETQYAYTSISRTRTSIYCLYAGGKGGQTCSSKIVVFDWNGEITKVFKLDKPVCSIYVDDETNTLYCYDDVEKSIFYASLN